MEQNKTSPAEILSLLFLELGSAAVITLAYYLLELLGVASFDFRVIIGALLGALVASLNHLVLTLSVNRAVNNYLALRGTREMTDEEAEQFAKENSAPIQNAIKLSFILRTVSMLAVLVIAFLTGLFDPVATAIPLLLYRPLLYLTELIKGKKRNEKK